MYKECRMLAWAHERFNINTC